MSPWENHRLEWSADPLSVALPTWQDITAYVHGPILISTGSPSIGSAAGTARPATLAATLENIDHRFTFGNTASPLSNWKPGRRVRCYEVIGNRRFDWFSGYMQPPETDDWAEKGADQFVTVTAVDRLGRFATARPFVSTLAEHVLYNGGGALRAYYPLGDPGNLYRPIVGAATYAPLTETLAISAGGDQAQNNYRAASAAIGADDLSVPAFAPQYLIGTPSIAIAETELTASYNGGAGITTTGASVTVACWVNPSTSSVNAQWRPLQVGFGTGLGGGYIRLRRTSNDEIPAQVWKASFVDDLLGAWSASAYGIGATMVPTLLACRINLTANTMSLFVNGFQFDATVTGTMPSSMLLLSAIVGDNYAGTLGHIQIYDSTSTSDHTFAAHQAQYAMGVGGLANQTTGQRIQTLAQYAGVGATELSYVDPGTSYMQRATLAGQTPLAEMGVAETAEQGRLRANGAGLLVFDPRTRRYQS